MEEKDTRICVGDNLLIDRNDYLWFRNGDDQITKYDPKTKERTTIPERHFYLNLLYYDKDNDRIFGVYAIEKSLEYLPEEDRKVLVPFGNNIHCELRDGKMRYLNCSNYWPRQAVYKDTLLICNLTQREVQLLELDITTQKSNPLCRRDRVLDEKEEMPLAYLYKLTYCRDVLLLLCGSKLFAYVNGKFILLDIEYPVNTFDVHEDKIIIATNSTKASNGCTDRVAVFKFAVAKNTTVITDFTISERVENMGDWREMVISSNGEDLYYTYAPLCYRNAVWHTKLSSLFKN